MPRISIIMPTFNSERYVEESILSVTAQTEPDFELILADDGSTDGTMEVLNRLAANDHRIVICPPSRTGSAGAARNRGLARARGNYIAFLDDDDLYHPEKIRQTAAVLDAFPEIDTVFHDFISFTDSPNRDNGDLTWIRFAARAAECLKEAAPSIYICGERFYAFMSVQVIPFHTSALMFRRTLLDSGALHFREDLRVGQDIELWLRLARRYRVAFLDRVLSYYRRRPGSLTSDPIAQLLDSIHVHAENLERGRELLTDQEARLCQSKLADKFFDLGYQYFRINDRREARIAYRKSMDIEFGARTFVAYLKTFAPEALVRIKRRLAVFCSQRLLFWYGPPRHSALVTVRANRECDESPDARSCKSTPSSAIGPVRSGVVGAEKIAKHS
jgi:glycosyltransferase involved in cell wall biosynthesis